MCVIVHYTFFFSLNSIMTTSGSATWALIDGARFPVGVIMPFAGTSTSLGPSWMLCDGRSISRTLYSNLYAAISDAYGGGDGSTSFNIPDLRGRTIFGAAPGNAVGNVSGHAKIPLGAMPSHTHTMTSDFSPGALPALGDHTHPQTGVMGVMGWDQGITNLGAADNVGSVMSHPIMVLVPPDEVAGGSGNTGTSSASGATGQLPSLGSITASTTPDPVDYLPPCYMMNFIIRCK